MKYVYSDSKGVMTAVTGIDYRYSSIGYGDYDIIIYGIKINIKVTISTFLPKSSVALLFQQLKDCDMINLDKVFPEGEISIYE